MLTPRWAHQPLSGAGAAQKGGRFNRPGQPAVYLALDTTTAIEEYRQSQTVLPPGMIAQYRIELAGVVDLSAGYEAGGLFDPLWEEWSIPWKQYAFIDRIEPPTWLMGDLALAAGYAGLLFPSTRNPGGTNLVVYTAHLQRSDVFSVHDPNGDLPRSQDSWRR